MRKGKADTVVADSCGCVCVGLQLQGLRGKRQDEGEARIAEKWIGLVCSCQRHDVDGNRAFKSTYKFLPSANDDNNSPQGLEFSMNRSYPCIALNFCMLGHGQPEPPCYIYKRPRETGFLEGYVAGFKLLSIPYCR